RRQGHRGRGLPRPAGGVGDLRPTRYLLITVTTNSTDDPHGRTPDHVRAVVTDLTESLVTVRRDLHAHPELAWQEQRTTAVLGELLTDAGVHVRTLATTGLVAEVGRDAGTGESDTTTVAL